MGKGKTRMKTARQKAIEEADKKWSLRIRAKCKCELCGKEGDIKSFDAHHIKKRSNMSTRWDLDNGACLCKGCHRFKVHMDTLKAAELIYKLQKKRKAEWYTNLVKKSNQIVKYTTQEIKNITKSL